MSIPRSQFRLSQITSSLPQSNELALTATPSHNDLSDTLKSLASSVRRLNAWDDNTKSFYSEAQVFKSMASENRFVILDNQKLYVSSSTLLNGTTEVLTATGEFTVSGNNAATINVGSKLNLTGSSLNVKASSGNLEFESASGTSFIEDGTEVFSINASRKAKFHQNAGTLASPDVEFDGKVRFDGQVAISGSSISLSRSTDQIIEKNNSGDMTLSGSAGRINFIDSNASTSTWADKAKGLPLSTAASDWSSLQSSGVTSIINGLGTTLSANKYIASLSAPLSAGSATSMNIDLTYVTDAQVAKRVDVFLNGVLLNSGSLSDIGNDLADYTIDLSGGRNDAEVKFSIGLEVDDIITVSIR